MLVKVRFYALYRDKLGPMKVYEFPEGSKVKDLLDKLRDELGELYDIAKPVILINSRYADEEDPLSSEVDVIPPAAGGKPNVIITSKDDVDVDSLINDIVREDTGAVVVFVGFVKSKGGKVKELVYEAHESLKEVIQKKIDEIEGKYDIHDALVVQFLGTRKVGQKTLIVAVSAEDRNSAFDAARDLLEKLKHEIPIWKLERRMDGEYWLVGEDKEVKRF